MPRFALIAGLFASLTLWGCDNRGGTGGTAPPKPKELKPGGVYVAYNLGCDKGCDQIAKGDLIQKIDGQPVKTGEDFDNANIADGKPHKLDLLAHGSLAPKQVELTAQPKNDLPPIKDAPPLWTVGAENLNKAPDPWARRRMFGHASPSVMLVNSNGGILDGRQLHGKKRLLVYWDRGDRVEQANAVAFLQVLQKAQSDLKAKGVEVMFVHLKFPTGRQAAMNDSDLRAFQNKWTVEEGGQKLPQLEMYRFPNETEFNQARELGLENAFTVLENLGQSPALVLLDSRGIVRWHSEGVETPPQGAEVTDPAQYTIIEAVKFSLDTL